MFVVFIIFFIKINKNEKLFSDEIHRIFHDFPLPTRRSLPEEQGDGTLPSKFSFVQKGFASDGGTSQFHSLCAGVERVRTPFVQCDMGMYSPSLPS